MIENVKNNTIELVVNKELCIGCGTCDALCSRNAIKLSIDKTKGIYIPRINKDICNKCGICHEICPRGIVDYEELNKEIFEKEPENIFIGNYQNCYIAHAINTGIRYNSSSGGLITQLLIFALEKGIINGALVTRMNKSKPIEPEPFIARTKEEIIEASKSKYCPVPANIALEEIIKSKKGEKFAVVGLPCHINGIRRAEHFNKKLAEKIVLHLGIFCNHTPNYLATEIYLKKKNIKQEDISRLNYRGEGWPGSMKILLKDGQEYKFKDFWIFGGSHFFYPKSCLFCSDGVSELADISFGDAWLPEYSHDKMGKSIIISKNMKGEELLKRMKTDDVIELNKISVGDVVRSQTEMFYFKKKNLEARCKLYRIVPCPNNIMKSNSTDYLLALFPCFISYTTSNPKFSKILQNIPFKLIHLYMKVFNKLVSKNSEK